MARYNSRVSEFIKEHINIVDVISSYVKLERAGRNYKGLCPFHNEKTASFSVSVERQFYHCFGCSAGGDVISFIQNIESLDFIDAIEYLADKNGIDISSYIIKNDKSKYSNITSDDKKKLTEINRAVAIHYYKELPNSNIAMKYLKDRGLDNNTIREFGLGYAPDDWQYLNKKFEQKHFGMLRDAGLVAKSEKGNQYDYFRNRIIFPIKNIRGQVIAFGARVLDDSLPKYLNSPETLIFNKSGTLYGLYQVKKELSRTKKVIVTEGYMDVIALYQHGIKNAVATLGTAFTEQHAKLLSRYADEIIICFDGDNAGMKATLRTLDILSEVLINVKSKIKILSMPNSMDPDEYIRQNGKDEFIKLVNDAFSVIEYRLKLCMDNNDLQSLEGRSDFARQIIDIIAKLPDLLDREIYSKKVAPKAHLDWQNLLSMVNKKRNELFDLSKSYKNNSSDNTIKSDLINNNFNNKKDPIFAIEYRMLEIALGGKENFNKLNSNIDITNLKHSQIQYILEYLIGYYSNNDKFDAKVAMEDIELKIALKLQRLLENSIPVNDIQKEIALISNKYKELILRDDLKTIKFEIQSFSDNLELSEQEKNKFESLIEQQQQLSQKLKVHLSD